MHQRSLFRYIYQTPGNLPYMFAREHFIYCIKLFEISDYCKKIRPKYMYPCPDLFPHQVWISPPVLGSLQPLQGIHETALQWVSSLSCLRFCQELKTVSSWSHLERLHGTSCEPFHLLLFLCKASFSFVVVWRYVALLVQNLGGIIANFGSFYLVAAEVFVRKASDG